MKRLLFILIICSHTLLLISQDKVWSLNDCISYAIEHSPKVKNQGHTNSIYHQDYLEAIGKLLPSINANTSAGFNFGRGVDAETNTYINVNSFSNNYGISASLTLFDGLANYRRIKIGRINKMKGKQELENTKDMLAYETIEAFYNVLYNTDLVTSAEEQLKESTDRLHQTKRMEQLGVKGMPDIAEDEAKVAEDTYNLTRQKNLLTISIIQLKEKMNFPIDEVLNVEKEDCTQEMLKIEESAYEIYERAFHLNSRALIAESNLNIKSQTYKASKGNLMPSLSVGGGISTNFFRNMNGADYTSFSEQFKNKRGEYVSITLSIPLFSGFSRSSSVKKAKAQLLIAQNEKDDTLRKLYSDIEQAVADVNGQVDEYYQAIKQRAAAEAAHNTNIRKYQEGMIDPILLSSSSNRLLKAKAEESKSKYMYYLKSRLIDYYKGDSLYTID